MNYSELFRVKPGSKVKLDDIDPNFTAKHKNQKSALPKLEKYTQKLRDLQYLLYAEGKQSLLICLQALDGAGKDGTINHVFWTMNPQGARVHGVQGPLQGGSGARFPLAHPQADTGQGRSGHFQPLPLRRRPRCARPQPCPRGRVVKAVRRDQRLREEPCRQRHPHPEVLSPHQPGRTAPALSGSVSTTRRATGKSASRTTRNGSSGTNTRRPTKTL